MIAAIDVCYGTSGAVAAGLLWRAWEDAAPAHEIVERVAGVADYEPGAFYKRELPCLIQVLAATPVPVTTVVVDGYVWLSADGRKGLGAHLFEALDGKVAVVGVAKTAFMGSAFAIPVLRGGSAKPLFVTAAGMRPEDAADGVRRMHGKHRVPTLLERVDRLCREGA